MNWGKCVLKDMELLGLEQKWAIFRRVWRALYGKPLFNMEEMNVFKIKVDEHSPLCLPPFVPGFLVSAHPLVSQYIDP